MKKIALVLTWLILASLLSAQELGPEKSFRFSGFVKNSIDSICISNVHILNLTKGTGTVSSLDGSFELRVRDNDTLKFSSIGYRERYLLISKIVLREDVMIFLDRDTVLMDEFLVHPLGPRRFFKYQFMALELPEPEFEYEINENFFRMKEGEGPLPATGIHFTGPVQGLYNLFNKKERTSRKLRRNRKKYQDMLEPIVGDSLIWVEEK